jgi:hypothetical protein
VNSIAQTGHAFYRDRIGAPRGISVHSPFLEGDLTQESFVQLLNGIIEHFPPKFDRAQKIEDPELLQWGVERVLEVERKMLRAAVDLVDERAGSSSESEVPQISPEAVKGSLALLDEFSNAIKELERHGSFNFATNFLFMVQADTKRVNGISLELLVADTNSSPCSRLQRPTCQGGSSSIRDLVYVGVIGINCQDPSIAGVLQSARRSGDPQATGSRLWYVFLSILCHLVSTHSLTNAFGSSNDFIAQRSSSHARCSATHRFPSSRRLVIAPSASPA